MKKVDLGQTVATIANIGVVIGLALLAMEINQANRQAEANAYQTRMTEIEQARQNFALSERLPAIYVKIRESGLESLTDEERTRVLSWEAARLRRLEAQRHQYVTGFLDRETYEGTLTFAAGLQSFWKKLGISGTDAAFQAEIDEVYLTTPQIEVPEVEW